MKKIFYTILFLILMAPGFANAVAPDAAKEDPLYYRLMQIHHSGTNPLDYRLTEYEMRAVFIHKILTWHITWPDHKKKSAIRFCIAGENNPFPYETLQELISISKKAGYNLEINTDADYHEIPNCDVIYVNSTKPDVIKYFILATKNLPILTIGESNNFTTHEFGMIGLNLTNRQTIGLNVNPERLKEKGLQASIELLDAANDM